MFSKGPFFNVVNVWQRVKGGQNAKICPWKNNKVVGKEDPGNENFKNHFFSIFFISYRDRYHEFDTLRMNQ